MAGCLWVGAGQGQVAEQRGAPRGPGLRGGFARAGGSLACESGCARPCLASTPVHLQLIAACAHGCCAAVLRFCSRLPCAALISRRADIFYAFGPAAPPVQEHQRYHEVLVAEENKRRALLEIVYALEVGPRAAAAGVGAQCSRFWARSCCLAGMQATLLHPWADTCLPGRLPAAVRCAERQAAAGDGNGGGGHAGGRHQADHIQRCANAAAQRMHAAWPVLATAGGVRSLSPPARPDRSSVMPLHARACLLLRAVQARLTARSSCSWRRMSGRSLAWWAALMRRRPCRRRQRM